LHFSISLKAIARIAYLQGAMRLPGCGLILGLLDGVGQFMGQQPPA